MQKSLKFFAGFLRNPFTTGSVVPSSPALAHRLIDSEKFRTASFVIEIGPGTGAVTEVILSRMRDRTHYLGLDLEPAFVATLTKTFPDARFLCDSVANLP